MIISRLDLKAFGCFTDVSLDLSADPHRFHLIYGPNESGKSTSLRAITALLFGMPHISEDNYLHANPKLRVGGLLVDSAGNELECMRRRGRKATLRDGDDDQPIEEGRLAEMLGGINRETFLTRFGLSHDELVEGGSAVLHGEGDLGELLFAAGAGIGRLREIQDDLEATCSGLFTARGSKSAVNAAINDLESKRRDLRQAQIPPAEFSGIGRQLDSKREELEELTGRMQSSAVTLARLQNYEQALPLLPQWRSIIESLAAAKPTPSLDEAFTERRRQAVSDREVAASREAELQNRISELNQRLEALPSDSVVINHEAEIQAIFQEVSARDSADRDRLNLIRLLSNADRKIIDSLRDLGVQIQDRGSEHEKAEAISEAVERLRVGEALRSRIRELASQYDGLISRRNDSSDAVEATKRRLADVTSELDAVGSPPETAVLVGAIESVSNPQQMLEDIGEQQASCDAVRRRCEELMRRLDGFHGSLDQAVRLQLPSDSSLKDIVDSWKTAEQRIRSATERRGEVEAERDEIARQIAQEQADQPLPTAAELTEARNQRDRVTDRVADLARAGDDASEAIEELRLRIRETDQLADTMRTHHSQVHRRETLASRIAGLNSQLADNQTLLSDSQNELQSIRQQWDSRWTALGIKPGSPERMQRWLADHEQLCDAAQGLSDAEKRLEQSRARVSRAVSRLRGVVVAAQSPAPAKVATAFQGELFDDAVEEDLVSYYDQALALRGQWQRAQQQYDLLFRRREELAEELPQAETRFEAAHHAVQQWREDWRRAVESFSPSDRASTQEVLHMVDQISELTNKKRERDVLAKRIRSIGEDELAYAARVERIASAVGKEPASNGDGEQRPATAVAQGLYGRLQAERTAARSRETFREQIESSKQRLAEAVAQRQECSAVLKQLCSEAGCQSADELPEIERAARERVTLQASLRDLENQLSILAGDQSMEEFIDAAGQQQPGMLDVEVEQRTAELAELREAITRVQREIGALQHELERIDGSGRASELIQSIQLVAGQISHDAEQYARTKIALLILRRAMDHYQKENQSPVMAHANRFFQQLTRGEYTELKPDYDAKGVTTLFGINAAGTAVPAKSMSKGTADALYLSLRLASLQYQLTHGEPIPLVIDDCLIQLDDGRAAAALEAFSTLSTQTQVILFTHHQHLIELAEQHLASDAFHLHRL